MILAWSKMLSRVKQGFLHKEKILLYLRNIAIFALSDLGKISSKNGEEWNFKLVYAR